MNPDQRIEHKVMALMNRELAEGVIAKLEWHRKGLYKAKKEIKMLKDKQRGPTLAEFAQLGRY